MLGFQCGALRIHWNDASVEQRQWLLSANDLILANTNPAATTNATSDASGVAGRVASAKGAKSGKPAAASGKGSTAKANAADPTTLNNNGPPAEEHEYYVALQLAQPDLPPWKNLGRIIDRKSLNALDIANAGQLVIHLETSIPRIALAADFHTLAMLRGDKILFTSNQIIRLESCSYVFYLDGILCQVYRQRFAYEAKQLPAPNATGITTTAPPPDSKPAKNGPTKGAATKGGAAKAAANSVSEQPVEYERNAKESTALAWGKVSSSGLLEGEVGSNINI